MGLLSHNSQVQPSHLSVTESPKSPSMWTHIATRFGAVVRALGAHSGAPTYMPELRLGGAGLYCSAGDLCFGADPVIEVTAVLAAALLVEFIRATPDFLFKIRVRIGRDISELSSDWLFRHEHSSSHGLKGETKIHPCNIVNVC